VESIRRAADELRDELEKARVAEAVEAGQVQIVYPAPLPARPIGSGRAAKVSLGLLLGLLIGGLAAFFREHMNTAIVRREDLERLQVINLGVVPRVGDEGKGRGRKVWLPIRVLGAPAAGAPRAPGGELVTVSSPTSPAAEAYRSLRTNLIFSHAVRELKTIVVTSSGPAEGKTLTSCNLAVAFAQQGLRVLLVDADMRKPRVHRVFGLEREAGLSETILGYRAADETIRPTAVDGLFVLPAGTPPPNPSELLGGAGMRALVAEMRGRFDLVLFDTPPVLAASDSAVLGAGVDGVVVVVRAGQTESGAAAEALDHLTGVGSRVVGAVLNDPEAKLPRYGGYYYSYGYYTHEA
jgi:capsular exopolysaccharide synthesis family protein